MEGEIKMRDEEVQHIFTTKINSWVPMRAPYHLVFDEKQREQLAAARTRFKIGERKVLFLSFENKYAACGGLAAVTRYLPVELTKKGERVSIITPFHPNHAAVKKALDQKHIKPVFTDLVVRSGQKAFQVSCFKDVTPPVETIFIGVDGFFQAQNDPYDYSDNNLLLYDALVYAAVLPAVLQKLGLTDHLLLHANDWETALVAITSKRAVFSGTLKHAFTLLTLHNSFDSHLPQEIARRFMGTSSIGETVLQSSMPFLDSPLTTVSTAFAMELRNDPMQCELFAPHLQHGFGQNPPIGIENGLFGNNPPGNTDVTVEAVKNRISVILQEKRKNRETLERYLSNPPGDPAYGSVTFDRKRKHVPVFLMSGRLDLMQKGFDVIFNAFRRLSPGKAKLVFTPSNPQNGNKQQLSFFTDIASERAGDIAIWPFRLDEKSYHQCLSGASFLVMPSFYEPFGAASEGFLHGTPVIARATGGLIGQIHSANQISLPLFYKNLVDGSKKAAKPNGILYREQADWEGVSEQWRSILSQPVEKRADIPLYNAMVDAAVGALETALEVYHNPLQYGELVGNGIDSLHRFSWDLSVSKYCRVYDLAIAGR